ncbi:DEAD/DEAH box helicase [Mesorhizobium sp. M2A.F.Ca.ET.067.02.1.1]|uniref:DEAD/DEAH box helicase n=1 Tax=Mesorhizobium sp. M2A.F.Ca.ET.067.02.1.1 TaxID=2496749 RepID=UPI000FD48702|nr:DEAD/DEAH box helicase [Mesorhizobium sp. M2A.F.Ca.ET.067.02.1.1]RUW71432.1 DEAD/DEAH box helicase [Mesorhizobium sp. M2A.F.Ca.ET.067.02.1.1]TIU58375.1 MAG: DEAD/DEAH box helicase [Mesorhizobium sp.]
MGSETSTRLKRNPALNLGLRHTGFLYQLEAVEAVKNLPYAALFHEQGLGKTKIAIDLALEWLKTDAVDTVVFVTKRTLVQNWQDEIKAHSYLHPTILDQNHSGNFFALNSPSPVFLVHYEVFRTEQRRLRLFAKTRRVGIILDEAQKIKNPESDLARAFHAVAPVMKRRIIMTGTPVANRPYDIWSLIYFLDQGAALGPDFEAFKSGLDLTNDLWVNEKRRNAFEDELAELFDRIRPFTVRETKLTAGIELPEKRIENVAVEMSPRQQALYEEYRTELGASIVVGDQQTLDDAEESLKRLLRLVQVASNPLLVDEAHSEIPGKFAKLRELVMQAVDARSKIIVWTSFVKNADWLHGRLAEFGAVKVHGGVELSDRNDAISSFKGDPSVKVLVATPGAAKEGLTLTVANHAVFYDRSFSLDDYLQAQDRIHRISQTDPCFIWNLISLASIDEWVDSLLAAKRLSAQLGQADISKEEYRRLANYDFGKMIREILGLDP